MDANQLQELATNALLDHWPPHLGVGTDAEKIAYLAERLREAVQNQVDIDALTDEAEALREEAAEWQSKAESVLHKLGQVRELVA
jgi:hypothetical protein